MTLLEPAPIVLSPLPVSRPWGGDRVARVAEISSPPPSRTTPIGEWWLLVERSGQSSPLLDPGSGPRDLAAWIESAPPSWLGRSHGRRFPLLVKLLDAAQVLSLQVHPRVPGPDAEPKTETWWILDAAEGAELFAGLAPGRGPKDLLRALASGEDPTDHLGRHPAVPGSVVHLPAGVVHAFGAGIVALEVQDNSDTTYRLFDWGRKPERALHLDAAREALSLDQEVRPVRWSPGSARGQPIAECDTYSVEVWSFREEIRLESAEDSFAVLVPFGNAIVIEQPGGETFVPRGHAVLVPASSPVLGLRPSHGPGPVAEVRLAKILPR
jgi:mannose-6-phosphate isomerase